MTMVLAPVKRARNVEEPIDAEAASGAEQDEPVVADE
jgi:hypothetical protein